MATPLRMRQTANSQAAKANPVPTELIMNSSAATFMVGIRPKRSAIFPAYQAPTAQPSRAMATSHAHEVAADMELVSDRVDGAVDYGAVEAEEEAADGGGNGQAAHVASELAVGEDRLRLSQLHPRCHFAPRRRTGRNAAAPVSSAETRTC